MPEFLQVGLIVAAVAYVLVSRFAGQPLRARRAVVLPLALAVIGGANVMQAAPRGLSAVSWAYIVVGGLVVFVLGALRGTSVRLYPNDGVLWLRYRPATAAWWLAVIAARIGLAVVGGALGVPAAVSGASVLLSVGLNLLGEAAVVLPRGRATGVPFASDGSRAGRLSERLSR